MQKVSVLVYVGDTVSYFPLVLANRTPVFLIYTFFFIMVYHRILNIVPCVIQ